MERSRQQPARKGRSIRIPRVDVAEVRRDLGLSQQEFAARFGFTVASIRRWEDGESEPYGVARTLLAVIATHPEAVDEVLRIPEPSMR